MRAFRNRRGFGMIELLVSLAVIVATTYFLINRRVSGSRSNAESSAIEAAQKRLEAQGIQVSTNLGAELKKIDESHEKSVDCASSESTTCKVEQSPLPQ